MKIYYINFNLNMNIYDNFNANVTTIIGYMEVVNIILQAIVDRIYYVHV